MPVPEARATMSLVVLTDAHRKFAGHTQPDFVEFVKLGEAILRRRLAARRSSRELTVP